MLVSTSIGVLRPVNQCGYIREREREEEEEEEEEEMGEKRIQTNKKFKRTLFIRTKHKSEKRV